MPLWLAVMLLLFAAFGIVLCRKFVRGSKTMCILCVRFHVLLALAYIVYIGLTILFVDAVRNQLSVL